MPREECRKRVAVSLMLAHTYLLQRSPSYTFCLSLSLNSDGRSVRCRRYRSGGDHTPRSPIFIM